MTENPLAEQLHQIVSGIDLSNKSTTKFQHLKPLIREILGIPANEEIYCSTIGKGMGNVNARMQQMRSNFDRARISIFVGFINNIQNLLGSQTPVSQTRLALGDPAQPIFKGSIWVDNVHGTWKIARASVRKSETELVKKLQEHNPDIHVDLIDVPKANQSMPPMNAIEVNSDLILKLLTYKNVLLEGPAGVGKSFEISALTEFFDETHLSVFHPSSNYEDFIEGLRPSADGFETVDGAFLEFCKKAARIGAESPEAKFLFVIDEINRANTSKVLGDLLFSLEASKRVNVTDAHIILNSNQPIDLVHVELQNIRTDSNGAFRQRFVVPENVYVLGTANTTDRSVGFLDLALRRRFLCLRIRPLGGEALAAIIQTPTLDPDIFEWEKVNKRLAELIGMDAQLGHSYFFDFVRQGINDSSNIWQDLLLPQLCEVLVAFNALSKLDQILADLETGGYTLKSYGSGFDAYPVVEPRSI